MKTDRQGFDESEPPRRQCVIHNELGGGKDDLFGQPTILLYAKRLIIPAGVQPALAARRACSAVGIRHDDDPGAHAKLAADTRSDFKHFAADLMPGDARKLDQRIEALERVEVAAAQTDMPHADANVTGASDCLPTS